MSYIIIDGVVVNETHIVTVRPRYDAAYTEQVSGPAPITGCTVCLSTGETLEVLGKEHWDEFVGRATRTYPGLYSGTSPESDAEGRPTDAQMLEALNADL